MPKYYTPKIKSDCPKMLQLSEQGAKAKYRGVIIK